MFQSILLTAINVAFTTNKPRASFNIYSVAGYHTGDGVEYWDKIVVIHIGEPRPRSLPIKDSKDAARLLLSRWPAMEGRSYRRAVLNCSAALRGQGPSDVAQWSFVVAAMEAAISYDIIDRFDSEIEAVCKQLLADATFSEDTGASSATTPPFVRPSMVVPENDWTKQPFWWPAANPRKQTTL